MCRALLIVARLLLAAITPNRKRKMSDLFKTVVAVVPANTDPYVFQAEAQAVSLNSCAFVAEFTTDQEGSPPPTHFLASGFIPEEAVAALDADSRFVLSDERWTVVAAQLGLTRVVPLE